MQNDYMKMAELEAQAQEELNGKYRAEIDALAETIPKPVIEENISFDEEAARKREEEEIEASRRKVQEISEELITVQKYTDISDINRNIVSMVENSDLAEIFPNEVMDYSSGSDPMLMLFDLADNAKNAEAQNILGVCCFSGINVEINMQKSMEYFHDAAEQGHSGAMRNLAIVMESMENPDKNEIISLYEKAAEKDDAYAINNLAVSYLTGDGIKRDTRQAVKLFEKAVKLGDDYAMVNLANCYSLGNGVKFSGKEAFRLYEKAAEKGNIEGLRNAAECLLIGKGTKQNLEAALSYFTKAAQLGDIKSQQRAEEISEKLKGRKHDKVTVKKSEPQKKKSLSDVMLMGKQAAERKAGTKTSEKTIATEKGERG